MEVCVGIDDTKPADIKIMPRVPRPLKGIKVADWITLIPAADGLDKAKVRYSYTRPGRFEMQSNKPIPKLSVRLGPYDEASAQRALKAGKAPAGCAARIDRSGPWEGKDASWIWVEGLTNSNVAIWGFFAGYQDSTDPQTRPAHQRLLERRRPIQRPDLVPQR